MAAPGPSRQADDARADWETPVSLFNPLYQEFRFTVDGAANESNHQCVSWLGPGGAVEDAFAAYPFFETIWCNPPYGRALKNWIDLFIRWNEAGNTVVACLPDGTDTEWFKKAYDSCHEVRVLFGRVPFVGTTSGNTGGTIIVIWRPGPKPPMPFMWLWDWRKSE